MKPIISLLITFLSLTSTAQVAFEYGYDDAGNRVVRQVIHLRVAPNEVDSTNLLDENEQDLQAEDNTALSEEENRIEDQVGKEDIQLYPNPTLSKVNIAFTEENVKTEKVQVYDGQGNVILEQKNKTGNLVLDFTPFPPGSYFIWVQVKGEVKKFQVVKH